jgi:hypothetical protein
MPARNGAPAADFSGGDEPRPYTPRSSRMETSYASSRLRAVSWPCFALHFCVIQTARSESFLGDGRRILNTYLWSGLAYDHFPDH